jgi:hypothetical protein
MFTATPPTLLDLVRERNFAVPCVTRLRTLHVGIVSWRRGLDAFAWPF